MRDLRRRTLVLALVAFLAPLLTVFSAAGQHEEGSREKPSLEKALAELEVPPPWFETTRIQYDTQNPWKKARLEIRRLLGVGKTEQTRRAIKLTYIYKQKDDIGNGHEFPMYLFMGGELAWATIAHVKFLETHADGATHAYLSLASCYRHFGEYKKAENVLQRAMSHLPEPPWRIARRADVHAAFGDLYAETGALEKAKTHYRKAIDLYPKSDQPYGRHLLKRRADKVQSRLDRLTRGSLEGTRLRDGTYQGRSLGYNKEIRVKVQVSAGRIADIKVDHQEKIDLNATTIIPKRIVEKQSLDVDGITGATVTKQAIVDGTYQALKRAGLR